MLQILLICQTKRRSFSFAVGLVTYQHVIIATMKQIYSIQVGSCKYLQIARQINMLLAKHVTQIIIYGNLEASSLILLNVIELCCVSEAKGVSNDLNLML